MSDALLRLVAAVERFPRITFATGFGVEGCVILDLIGRNRLPIDVFTLDTGVLFPETLALWRRLEDRYGLTIRAVRAERPVEHGLWLRDPDACCHARKVVPLRRELARFDAWVTAIRRDQTPDRASALPVEDDAKFGLVKINPLVDWTIKDVWRHVHDFDVPYNPLHDRGYPSIGCEPCTVPVALGENPRAGRWRGLAKTECGLHTKEP
ncbi:MAG TPA: phosphoadenylyl-sulfate reductase [Haliangiales bacterium]|nr:phosphoadenylyl-sulfate reductase [Haliangiales bacterium]